MVAHQVACARAQVVKKALRGERRHLVHRKIVHQHPRLSSPVHCTACTLAPAIGSARTIRSKAPLNVAALSPLALPAAPACAATAVSPPSTPPTVASIWSI